MLEETLADSLFETMFSQAVNENFMDSLEEIFLDKGFEETLELSEFHEARMRKLFAKTERRERIKIITKWSRQAAAIVVVLTTALFGSLMLTSADVRAAVFSTVIHCTDEVAHFFHVGINNELLATIEPKYIPNGFTESARIRTEDLIAITYTNKLGSIMMLRAIPSNSSLEINIVDMEYDQITIEDIVYHIFNANNAEKLNYIIWDTDNRRYYVGAQLPIDQLMEVAQSLK